MFEFFQALSDQTKYFYQPHPFDSETAKKIAQTAGQSNELRLVAIIPEGNKEKIIGYGTLSNLDSEAPSVGLCVRDGYQNQGLGTQILIHLTDIAKRLYNKKSLQLSVFKDNLRALHLYRKLGFQIIGETEDKKQHRMILYL